MSAVRNGTVRDAFKSAQVGAGDDCCAVCRWRPPRVLRELAGGPILGLLHGHHVVPIACGGADDQSNLLLVCPNHHAIAHRLGTMYADPPEWVGPQTPAELVLAIELATSRPAEFKKLAAHDFRVPRYLEDAHDEAIAQDAVEDVRINRRFTLTRGRGAL